MMMNRTDMIRYIAERLGNLASNDDAERLYLFLRDADAIRATEAGELEIDSDIDLLAEYERMESGAGYLTLTDAGQQFVRTTVSAVVRDGADPEGWFSDAEQAANNAAPGEDIVIEVGRQYSRDGQPHTITLRRELFA
jgi:predicted nucleotidyltransferase